MKYHLQASCVGWANSWRLSTVSTQHADLQDTNTAWKVSKYGVISGPYFPVFGLNTAKYGPEITPYLENFHAVLLLLGILPYLFGNLVITVTF